MAALSGFFDAFSGKSQRRDLDQGYQDSQRYLDQGRSAATGHITQGRDNAVNYVRPFMEGGMRGQTAYENTLGLNGDAARSSQFGDWQRDPALAYRNQNNMLQMNALLRKYNAGGTGVNSGAATLGAGRLATEQFNNDWGGYQNRLQGLGQQGLGAAGQMGNWTYGAGKDLADTETGFANTSASNRINIANARAASRSTGINNLLNLFGTGAKAAAAFA